MVFTFLWSASAFAVPTGTGAETIPLGSDSGDDLNVGSNKLVVEGDTGNVGIGTASPASKLQVEGSMGLNTTTITGNTTLDDTHNVVLCNPSGDITVTLPASASNTDKVYYIKKIDAAGDMVTIDGNGSETIDGATTIQLYEQYDYVRIACDGSNWHTIDGFQEINPMTAEGRLTLTSGTAVTTSDVTAATTVYFTPYKGTRVALYDGSKWYMRKFSELSVSVPSTTNTPFDIFSYDNSGALTLETVNWTDDTTRATAITLQDGIYVKSGTTTRRYLGTCRTTGTSGQTEDSATKRFVWNYYNRAKRKLLKIESTSEWTYGTTTWRSLNNSTSNRVEVVAGWNEINVELEVKLLVNPVGVGDYGIIGIDVDGTSTNDADIIDIGITNVATSQQNASCNLNHYPSVGYHYYQATEYASTATNVTFYGTSGLLLKYGIFGWVEG